jgi:hypothetical protein
LVFLLYPFLDIVKGQPFDISFFIKLLISLSAVSILYINYNRVIAEIKGDEIFFYQGVGIKEPSSLKISQINEIERTTKKMLKIRYDNDKIFSVQVDKNLLNRIEEELKKRINKFSNN